jgi:oligogalacturonide lyase
VLCDTAHPDIGLQLVDVATGQRQTVCHPHSSNGGSQWRRDRYALAEDWAAAAEEKSKALSWMEMKTDTVYGPQWTHPHPSFSPSERWVVYTSDVTGSPQVYAAELGSHE